MDPRTDVPAQLAGQPALLRRTRFARFAFDVAGSSRRWRVRVAPEDVSVAQAPADAAPADFSITAEDATWAQFATALPPPGFNDLIAMAECGHARIEGDLLPFYRHLFLVKGLVALMFGKDWR